MDDTDHGGAARAWTSDEPRWVAWRELIDRGALREADALANGDADALELTRRMRHEWSHDRASILAKLREELADAGDADLDAWAASGAIAHREIDGERRYFRREPRNLFLHDEASRQRRLAAGRPVDRADRHAAVWPLVSHLVKALAAADASETNSKRVLPVRTSFSYVLTVRADAPGVRHGAKVRAWLPFPAVHRQQQKASIIATTPERHLISPATSPHRTVYLEQTISDSAKPTRFELTAEFETSALVARPGAAVGKYDAPAPADVAERPPHVRFTDEVRSIVAEQSADSPDPTTLAKRLWNWVDDHVPWCAEHEYCLVPSIVAHGLKNRRGDCGVQTLIFISLCRCAGIPARWISGWTTEDASAGMHDWSEVWLESLGGWVPVDTSYGKKKSDDSRMRDFYFGGVDAFRMIVNTDYGRPLTPPLAGLRAEPLDFQRGEVELDGRVLYYDAWDFSFAFEHEWLAPYGEEKHAGSADRRSRGRR